MQAVNDLAAILDLPADFLISDLIHVIEFLDSHNIKEQIQ